MPEPQDKLVAAVMERLIEEGPESMAQAFTALFDMAMRLERERFLGAGHYERSEDRRGYANGYKPKTLDTPAGSVRVQVPKTAGTGEPFYPQSLERGRRSSRAVMLAIAEMYDHAAARQAVLPGTVWQRCQFHLAQNAIHHAPNAAVRKRIGPELRRVWNAATLEDAEAELDRLVAGYSDSAPRLAQWLEHNVPEGLAVMTLPAHHRRRMRTSNPVERAVQQEIKRRTQKVRVFPNRKALIRLVSAVLAEIDEDWATTDRVYINWNTQDD